MREITRVMGRHLHERLHAHTRVCMELLMLTFFQCHSDSIMVIKLVHATVPFLSCHVTPSIPQALCRGPVGSVARLVIDRAGRRFTVECTRVLPGICKYCRKFRGWMDRSRDGLATEWKVPLQKFESAAQQAREHVFEEAC